MWPITPVLCSTLLALRTLLLILAARAQPQHGHGEGRFQSGKTCSRQDITFFKSQSCKDGTVGQAESCMCANTKGNCELRSLRSYLPERSMFEDVYYNKHTHVCDRMFAIVFSRHLLQSRKIQPHNGYPQDCAKETECHTPSLGKYIRYNSLLLFHSYRGHANDTLAEISYSFPFRWAKEVSQCSSGNPDPAKMANGWGCAFQPLSQTLADHEKEQALLQHLSVWSNHTHTEAVEALMPTVDVARRSSPDHVSQILLYARMLSLLTTPSAVVRAYMTRQTTTLHGHVTQTHALDYNPNPHSGQHPSVLGATPANPPGAVSTIRSTGSLELSMLAEHTKPPPSISMHVRQGDSCDKILRSAPPGMTHYLHTEVDSATKDTTVTRPCFSIDVYMTALRELREQYGSTRVYLSTDSAEMLRRIHTEDSFTWILVNTTVAQYQGRKGPGRYIDFLPNSANEAVLMGGASDMHLLSRGDIFLGAFSSHFSKLLYYSMVGQHMRILPFRSLDYPLSCDSVDVCDKDDITKRGMTMERIAMWAPECIRGALPWSPSGKRDPCGIYT